MALPRRARGGSPQLQRCRYCAGLRPSHCGVAPCIAGNSFDCGCGLQYSAQHAIDRRALQWFHQCISSRARGQDAPTLSLCTHSRPPRYRRPPRARIVRMRTERRGSIHSGLPRAWPRRSMRACSRCISTLRPCLRNRMPQCFPNGLLREVGRNPGSADDPLVVLHGAGASRTRGRCGRGRPPYFGAVSNARS